MISLYATRTATSRATRVPSCAELLFHGSHVQVFEESVSESIVNLKKRPNNGMRKRPFNQLYARHTSTIPNCSTTQIIRSPRAEPSFAHGAIRSISVNPKHPRSSRSVSVAR